MCVDPGWYATHVPEEPPILRQVRRQLEIVEIHKKRNGVPAFDNSDLVTPDQSKPDGEAEFEQQRSSLLVKLEEQRKAEKNSPMPDPDDFHS
jgi:hypothetical protein